MSPDNQIAVNFKELNLVLSAFNISRSELIDGYKEGKPEDSETPAARNRRLKQARNLMGDFDSFNQTNKINYTNYK